MESFVFIFRLNFESSEEKLFDSSFFLYFLVIWSSTIVHVYTWDQRLAPDLFLLLLYESPYLWFYGYFLCMFESFCLSFCPSSWIDKFEMFWISCWGGMGEFMAQSMSFLVFLAKIQIFWMCVTFWGDFNVFCYWKMQYQMLHDSI